MGLPRAERPQPWLFWGGRERGRGRGGGRRVGWKDESPRFNPTACVHSLTAEWRHLSPCDAYALPLPHPHALHLRIHPRASARWCPLPKTALNSSDTYRQRLPPTHPNYLPQNASSMFRRLPITPYSIVHLPHPPLPSFAERHRPSYLAVIQQPSNSSHHRFHTPPLYSPSSPLRQPRNSHQLSPPPPILSEEY